LDDGEDHGLNWLLLRRNQRTRELAYYHCFVPSPVPLATLVRVAGRRWTIEERFQTGKGLCGLDQHQVRRWRSWYRWVTLAMLAHAFLVVAAATDHARHPPPPELVPCPATSSSTCSPPWPPGPLVIPATAGAGQPGNADTKPAPAPATTADKPPGNHEHHGLRLEY
jgi:hypothetical protein